MAFPQYGTNLFALNSLGEIWLNRAVTVANFRGPPLVLVNTNLFDTDPEVLAVIDFANYWNAPIVGFDRSVGFGAWAISTLRSACFDAERFFTMPLTGTFSLPVGNSTTHKPITGPWVSIESGGPATSVDAWDAIVAGDFIRTTQRHPYGCGMQGVSVFTDNMSAPPLYGIGLGLDTITALARMVKKWSGDSVATVAQHQALAAAASLRPGLARLCNPALLPELILVEPI